MKIKNKLAKMKGYIPKIVTKKYIDGLFEEIIQAEKQADTFCDERREAIKDKESLAKMKNNEINKLEIKIKDLQKELSTKNDSLEKVIIEKEQKSVLLAKKDDQISELESKLASSNAKSGGLTKENNRIRYQLEEKEKTISENKKLITDLQTKNEVQRLQIQELSKKVKHVMPEYQNSGLPKPTRKTFNRKRG